MTSDQLDGARTEEGAGALATYLDDHLAGSTAALQLLDHLLAAASTSEAKNFFTTLRAEIAEDQSTLESLAHRVGAGPSRLRQIGGWLAEQASRLKLLLDDPGGKGLRELESLEILGLGIQGKRALWRALAEVSSALPVLAAVDFPWLEGRADDQHARVEARRLLAARRALTPATEP